MFASHEPSEGDGRQEARATHQYNLIQRFVVEVDQCIGVLINDGKTYNNCFLEFIDLPSIRNWPQEAKTIRMYLQERYPKWRIAISDYQRHDMYGVYISVEKKPGVSWEDEHEITKRIHHDDDNE